MYKIPSDISLQIESIIERIDDAVCDLSLSYSVYWEGDDSERYLDTVRTELEKLRLLTWEEQ